MRCADSDISIMRSRVAPFAVGEGSRWSPGGVRQPQARISPYVGCFHIPSEGGQEWQARDHIARAAGLGQSVKMCSRDSTGWSRPPYLVAE